MTAGTAEQDLGGLEPEAGWLLRQRIPWLWLNPGWCPMESAGAALKLKRDDLLDAEQRWSRFCPLLAELFPELRAARGLIESDLVPVPRLATRLTRTGRHIPAGRWMLKADHALPVAGSIKARGGIYTCLHFAEKVAFESGLLGGWGDDYRKLKGREARSVFSGYTLSVGSTGNLGLSIGIMGKTLGFGVTVHMSKEAKSWKKERLRRRGVRVVEHTSDYTAACKVARAAAARQAHHHFIDDENSVELFLGYSVAALRLKRQLDESGIAVDAGHPLFLYLPCGVGGAPGGITFGARHVFGDDAHCFFVEPVSAPCMLLGMLTGRHSDVSVYDIGLKLETEADGLAVSTPSRFVGRMMESLLSGCLTVTDSDMFACLTDLYDAASIEVEPSSAAGCAGPGSILSTPAGRAYRERHALDACMHHATHVIWTTGGSFVPPEQHQAFRAQAARQRDA